MVEEEEGIRDEMAKIEEDELGFDPEAQDNQELMVDDGSVKSEDSDLSNCELGGKEKAQLFQDIIQSINKFITDNGGETKAVQPKQKQGQQTKKKIRVNQTMAIVQPIIPIEEEKHEEKEKRPNQKVKTLKDVAKGTKTPKMKIIEPINRKSSHQSFQSFTSPHEELVESPERQMEEHMSGLKLNAMVGQDEKKVKARMVQ